MVALDGSALNYTEVGTDAAGKLFILETQNRIGLWDLFYFILFNRFLIQFDIPTLLVVFIDGLTLKKRIAFCLIMHTLFRNIGGIMFGIIKFVKQEDAVNLWRFTTGYPTLPWYLGELFLDSYPFQKAWAVAGGKQWLKIVACIGFVPLFLYKVFIIVFRYYSTINAVNESEYFKLFNFLDAGAISAQAWNDIWSCFVIVYVGVQSRKMTGHAGNDFLANLVRTTEVRIVLCTILTIIPAVLLSSERCLSDSVANACIYNGARNIAVDIVYGLYFLDYLIIKYFKVVKGEKSTPVPGPSNNNDGANFSRNQNNRSQPKYSTDPDIDLTARQSTKNDEISFAAMMKSSDMRQRAPGSFPGTTFSSATSPLGNNSNMKVYSPTGPAYSTPQIAGATLSSNYVPQTQYTNLQHVRSQSVSQNQSQPNYGSAIDYGSSYDDHNSSVWYQSSSYSASNR